MEEVTSPNDVEELLSVELWHKRADGSWAFEYTDVVDTYKLPDNCEIVGVGTGWLAIDID